ncbi:hypothetical protein Tsp_01408 [Trichinella spiralis]|uniref:hypothetical protein n=1 Tax=Trichinella spiralis TaxID=6334 RepID=UPI0001EFB4CD|nr:hypothetical protein Tsp_01408 [Trichinella spiralis]
MCQRDSHRDQQEETQLLFLRNLATNCPNRLVYYIQMAVPIYNTCNALVRGRADVEVKIDNAFLYTCGNDVTASRSDAQLYRGLELPPNLPKTRGQENAFPNRI